MRKNFNMASKSGLLLSSINSVTDLRKLSVTQLHELAEDLRSFILDVVSVNPGHVGASLGVVELTIALHYLFNTPEDLLVWDVGHQAYSHKILSGRRDQFQSLRKWEGISGFPSRSESEFDSFGTGHASTALSAAVGMATAALIQNKTDRQHIAVIGDGALTGGMFFEALNHAGSSKLNLLIIINDNGISIDKSSGMLKDYLQHIRDNNLKAALFEAFGVPAYGPVNGNDLEEVLAALKHMKSLKGVRLLHIATTKGKGFEKAEKEQVRFHAPGVFNRTTGEAITETTYNLFQHVFGITLTQLAEQNPKIVGITPAMVTGSSLNFMMERFPERSFDVDIAEQHALTFAAGLATQQMLPYCVIYSTFLQRAYDQLIHDIALQQLPVVLCIDRAGLVGEDGATHHGFFDLAFLYSIPNMVVAAPMTGNELRNMMYTAQIEPKGPFAIRYPRGSVPDLDWEQEFQAVDIGKGRCLTKGRKIAIVSIGAAGNNAQKAIQLLENSEFMPSHYDLRFLKPIDEDLLHHIFTVYQLIITVEDGMLNGGMAAALLQFANTNRYHIHFIQLGIGDEFVPHGSPEKLQQYCGFDAASIANTVKENWQKYD